MTYIREMEHARRDAKELAKAICFRQPDDLTVVELAAAIGLADTAHRALLRAFGARHVTPSAPPAVTSRRGIELIGRAAKAGPQA